MKKLVLLAMLTISLAIYAFAGSYNETRTWTTTFTYLRGDSTVTDTAETLFYEMNLPIGEYRFNKLQYQADVTFGGMVSCSAWVQLRQGPGSDVNELGHLLDTLQSFKITQDSLYTTSGWDLIYTWAADSAKPVLQIRVIVQTQDSDSGASAGEKVDSSYTIEHTIHAWGHD